MKINKHKIFSDTFNSIKVKELNHNKEKLYHINTAQYHCANHAATNINGKFIGGVSSGARGGLSP